MQRKQRDAYHRGDRRGKSRAEDAPAEGKDEDIIKRDIRKAARHHRRHREPRAAVVAYKGEQNIIHDKK